MSADQAKINAATAALNYVKDGMTLGLGSGSTAAHFVRLLGERVRQGLRVSGVPTSEATRVLAEQSGAPLLNIDQVERLDLDVDGADEIDPQGRMIKGGGGALLREKIVASISDRMIVIVDEAKAVDALGAFPLPVEIIRFAAALTTKRVAKALRASGCEGTELGLRQGASGAYVTDNGNYILDCRTQRIPDPDALAAALKDIPGVVEHGLFIGLARTLIIGRATGAEIREL